MSNSLEIRLHESLADIPAADWDACAAPEGSAHPVDPFTTHRFLLALETSGSVGDATGWAPRYITVRDGAETIAVAPAYLKSHSHGEYVFDWGWADAYERAGGRYYPKLQIAVPFTPVNGRRFLTRPGQEARGQSAIVQGAVQVAAEAGLSSVHVTFCTDGEAAAGKEMGLLDRLGTQYHWDNDGYVCYDDFLATLASRKRKAIRR